ncbi:MAG: hypothetical protein WBQ45_12865, partial [Roseiarcus sp.]
RENRCGVGVMRGINDRERSEDPRAASSTTAEGAHSRAALLTGGSLLVLAAFVAPDAARAACSGANQTVSSNPSGAVFSTGGAITVPAGKNVIAAAGPGVDAYSCSVTTLSNQGNIIGGTGFSAGPGVGSSQTLTTLTNSGTIVGGASQAAGGAGGYGVLNIILSSDNALITTLTNNGTIIGGQDNGQSGLAGAGVANITATITTLSNNGAIVGGQGSEGGIGVYNASSSAIGSLDNSAAATIGGGAGGSVGGGGIVNYGTINKLSNSGTIAGGVGAGGTRSNAAIYNIFGGTITTLTNSGAMTGGSGVAFGGRAARAYRTAASQISDR